jgi:demethylmacrocin O-methyltransferase
MKLLDPVVKLLRNTVGLEQRRALRVLLAKIYPWNLNHLALIYGSDKWGGHFYTPHYDAHFRNLKKKKLRILEIGVGGYDDPHYGGASLRMWKQYFSNSLIYSIDIHDKSPLEEKRIKIFQGSQADEAFLRKVSDEAGPFDIIIDDGSHVAGHMLCSFKTLFPLLKDGGIYVLEDMQSFYWPDWGGNSESLDDPTTPMNFFKKLTDGLNYQEFLTPNYVPSYLDKNIIGVHFYHNLIMIYKGSNNEPIYPPDHPNNIKTVKELK